MLIVHQPGYILLDQRPTTGIWGGLWSLPEYDVTIEPALIYQNLGLPIDKTTVLASFLHVFTHFRLTIEPHLVSVARGRTPKINDALNSLPSAQWVPLAQLQQRALPAPVHKLLNGLITAGLIH
jgi:A/G-specific adenine glycosylase